MKSNFITMMPDKIKKWDDALLDLVNKGFVEIVKLPNGDKGFVLAGSWPKDQAQFSNINTQYTY
jgi:hypothetical protein